MLIRTSQNIRPPERKPTAFGEQLKAALEARQQSAQEKSNA